MIAKVKIAGPLIIICHGDEHDAASADVEVAVPIAGPVEMLDPGAKVKILPATRALSAVHKGSHELLHIAYRELFDCMARKGLEFHSPARELYLNNPHETPEEGLMVEILLPVS